MEQIDSILWKSSSGKVFKKKGTEIVGGELLLLGKNDSIDNWEEIDKPVEEVKEEE